MRKQFQAKKEEMRINTQKQILKMKEENQEMCNLRRQVAIRNAKNKLVKRTRLSPGTKSKPKQFGLHKVTERKKNNNYGVTMHGCRASLFNTVICTEYRSYEKTIKYEAEVYEQS